MMSLEMSHGRGPEILAPVVTARLHSPSPGASHEARSISHAFMRLAGPTPTFQGTLPPPGTLDEKMYQTLASFKVFTSQIAMHLDDNWRTKLFRQIDSLLDIKEWDTRDLPPALASFATFLRTMVLVRPATFPGIGATSNGHIVAAWTTGDDRLTVEYLPGDQVRWSVNVVFSGERERAAGIVPIGRLLSSLAPYEPQRWFARA